MHDYSINSSKRETVVVYISLLSLIWAVVFEINVQNVSGKIADALMALSRDESKQFYTSNGLEALVQGIAIFMPVGIYGILYWMYSKVFWRHGFFRMWHKIPDFSGKWIGEIERPLKDGKCKIELEIRQDWNRIQVRSILQSNGKRAVSTLAGIEVRDDEDISLNYMYDNLRGHCVYKGANTLKYDAEKNELKGEYFTDKVLNLKVDGTVRECDVNHRYKGKVKRKLIQEGLGSKGGLCVRFYKGQEGTLAFTFAVIGVAVIAAAPWFLCGFVG